MKKLCLILAMTFIVLNSIHAEYFIKVELPVECYNYLVTNSGTIFAQGSTAIYRQEFAGWVHVFNASDYLEGYVQISSQVIGNTIILRCQYGNTGFPIVDKCQLYLSHDYGNSWITGLHAVDDQFMSKIYEKDGIFYTLISQDLKTTFLRSINGGRNWDVVFKFTRKFETTDIFEFSNNIFFAGAGKYYRSSDLGQSWSETSITVPNSKINSLYSSQGSIFIDVYNADTYNSYIYRLNGANWELIQSFEGPHWPIYAGSFEDKVYYWQTVEDQNYNYHTALLIMDNSSLTQYAFFPYQYKATTPTSNDDDIFVCAQSSLYKKTSKSDGYMELNFDHPDESLFRPYDEMFLDAKIFNKLDQSIENSILFVALEAYGQYFFAPSWTQSIDGYSWVFPHGETIVQVLPAFRWPGGVGTGEAMFIGVLFKDAVYSNIATWSFEWGY